MNRVATAHSKIIKDQGRARVRLDLRIEDDAPVSDSRESRLAAVAGEFLGRRLELITRLRGGEHALTILVRGERDEYVVRLFPVGDEAGDHEVEVYGRLDDLGSRAPRLVGYTAESELGPIIITTRVPGGPPAPDAAIDTLAVELAKTLAKIHRLNGVGLAGGVGQAAGGDRSTGRRGARGLALGSTSEHRVLTHYDFWCGNALWEGRRLTGVVDWSGARHGPRGIDLAWCRLDLVLLGSPDAADVFLRTYQQWADLEVTEDITAWDLQAAYQADTAVETWAPNYHGIGRPELTAEVLRERLDAWSGHLIETVS